VSDFEYEFQMALMNRSSGAPSRPCLDAAREYTYISSRPQGSRQLRHVGAGMVPPIVDKRLNEKYPPSNAAVRREERAVLADRLKTLPVVDACRAGEGAELRRRGVDVISFGAGEPTSTRPNGSGRRDPGDAAGPDEIHEVGGIPELRAADAASSARQRARLRAGGRSGLVRRQALALNWPSRCSPG